MLEVNVSTVFHNDCTEDQSKIVSQLVGRDPKMGLKEFMKLIIKWVEYLK